MKILDREDSTFRMLSVLPVVLHFHETLLSHVRSANLICHWEDSDVVAQEVFSNVCDNNLELII